MSMKIQVLVVEHREGVAKSTKEAYSMDILHCNVFGDDGKVIEVGLLILPKGHEPVKPGMYSPVTGLRSYKGYLEPYLVSLSMAGQVAK